MSRGAAWYEVGMWDADGKAEGNLGEVEEEKQGVQQEVVFLGAEGQPPGRLAGKPGSQLWAERQWAPVEAAWERAGAGEQGLGRRERGGRFGEGWWGKGLSSEI